jgi:hypothetical protein
MIVWGGAFGLLFFLARITILDYICKYTINYKC